MKVQGIIDPEYWCTEHKKGEGEMFSVRNGRKIDSHIHDPIIAGVNSAFEERHRQQSYRKLIDIGVEPKDAAKALGIDFPEGDALTAGADVLA